MVGGLVCSWKFEVYDWSPLENQGKSTASVKPRLLFLNECAGLRRTLAGREVSQNLEKQSNAQKREVAKGVNWGRVEGEDGEKEC